MTPWRSKLLDIILPEYIWGNHITNHASFSEYKKKKDEEKAIPKSDESTNGNIPVDIKTDFPKFDNSLTIKDLQDKIDKSNFNAQPDEISVMPPKYLVTTCEYEIARMVKGESLLRIADIWYGKDKFSTVTGFSLFSDKQVTTLQPLRVDLAMSFSTSMSPVDTVQVEIICHISKIREMVQRLSIISEITPSVPLMNTSLLAIMQPVHHNRGIYEAYGIKAEELIKVNPDTTKLLKAYSSVPMQVHIDAINISYAGPRDIRMLVTITRTLTSNTYGDRILYCQSMMDSYKQHMFMKEFRNNGEDTDQLKAYGSVFNVYNESIDEMVNALKKIPRDQGDNYAPYEAYVKDVIDGDTIIIYNDSTTKNDRKGTTTIRLFGIDSPESEAFTKYLIISENTNTRVINAQPFSKEAKLFLQKLLCFKKGLPTPNSRVIVQPFGMDITEKRLLAEIYLPSKNDTICANLEMVKNGLAYTYSSTSSMDEKSMTAMTKYYDAQSTAKAKKEGVWSLSDEERELPSAFRSRIKESIQMDTHKRRIQS